MAQEPVRVIVEVNGGCVSNVVAGDFVEVQIVDYDNLIGDGAEPEATRNQWESFPQYVRDYIESNCPHEFAQIRNLIVSGTKPEPLRRRYFAIVPGITRMKARYIDVIGGHEKDSAGMDAAIKAAHKALGKSVNVKLIPVTETKSNITIKL